MDRRRTHRARGGTRCLPGDPERELAPAGAGGRSAPGVNAIASWEATTGLAEAARRSVRSLVGAGVPVALVDYDYGAPRAAHRLPADLRTLPRGRPYGVDLVFLNVNELHVVPETFLRPDGSSRPVVASWFWELATLPPDLVRETARVDEIWVASQFVAEVFRRHALCPVEIVPCVVEPAVDEGHSRRDFGLPDDRFLVLCSFDASSTLARKNPLATVEAFRRAFSPDERARSVHLVVKTINLASLPEASLALGRAVADVGGTILDVEMTESEIAALTSSCDVYVSLHRAEGFGLGIAEAMLLGRPVVATAYSGPADFLHVASSCPVGYRTTEVDAGDLRFNPAARNVYAAGETWAEPDVGEAARRLRMLYDHPELRRRIGASAAAAIRGRYSSAAVGRRMRDRLELVTACPRDRLRAARADRT